MDDLLSNKCIPCSIGDIPLDEDTIGEYIKSLDGWSVIDNKVIEKKYKFKTFLDGLDFINQIGGVAEEEGHHPDLMLSWGKVVVRLTTHKIKGLHKNDFIMAAKIDELYDKI
ncbi:4a-hydroxytetrahydrobiopterin dehydratase [Tissierella creatinini]|nr:4a-hydroxytetrahydrobiopterin dehydratase [Tissierella creatinini]TJX59529.1 4a-hydroxytetrahydrobiopterin dehydratase [Soehngenia saccharolytica]